MYVSDSLFFIQHMYTDKETDDDHGTIFGRKFREILEEYDDSKKQEVKPTETADDIKNRMIEKSKKLSGTKQ